LESLDVKAGDCGDGREVGVVGSRFESGMITVTNKGNAPPSLSHALSPTEVKVLGIVIDLPSSERRRVARL